MDRRFEKLAPVKQAAPDGKVTPAICARQDLDMPRTVIVIDEGQRYHCTLRTSSSSDTILGAGNAKAVNAAKFVRQLQVRRRLVQLL